MSDAKLKFILFLTNMRADRDQVVFKDFLLKLGNGSLPTIDSNNQLVRIPDCCLIPPSSSIIDYVFGKYIDPNDQTVQKKAILCPKNDARYLVIYLHRI